MRRQCTSSCDSFCPSDLSRGGGLVTDLGGVVILASRNNSSCQLAKLVTANRSRIGSSMLSFVGYQSRAHRQIALQAFFHKAKCVFMWTTWYITRVLFGRSALRGVHTNRCRPVPSRSPPCIEIVCKSDIATTSRHVSLLLRFRCEANRNSMFKVTPPRLSLTT